ncbi:hypothetical protein PSDI105340_08230 [Pseudoalteromonas distincta]
MHYGAVRGSYQANWLKSKSVSVHVEVNTLEELVNIFHHQRVDRILLDLDDFELVVSKLSIDKAIYDKEFFRYVPLGLFASNSLLKCHSEFMEQFDENIGTCSHAPFALSNCKKTQVLNLIYKQVKALVSLPRLAEEILIIPIPINS